MRNSSRALLAVVALMFGWSWWYSSYGIWEPIGLQPEDEQSSYQENGGPQDLPLQAGLGNDLERRHQPRDVPVIEGLEFEPGEWNIKENERSDMSVLIEVLVQNGSGLADMSSAVQETLGGFAGIDVSLQSWDEASDETETLVATTDGVGIARFEFDGDCHVDWIRADLPDGYADLAAFDDPHEDVPAGSVVRFSLVPAPGVTVVGRVTDTAGVPLGGVPVWAMSGDVAKAGKEIEDEWYPPGYVAETNSDGTYEFTALPDAYLTIGVAPGEWLQIVPENPSTADHPEWQEADPLIRARYAHLRNVMIASNIMIVPRERVELLVIDGAREPVPFARLNIDPIVLSAPNLLGEEAWDRRMTQAQTDWERERVYEIVPWRRSISLKSAEDGTATFFGVAGTWRIHAGTRIDSTEREFQITVLPGSTHVHELRFPQKMATLVGVVRDSESGKPIRDAKVRVYLQRAAEMVATDETGSFEMAGVPVDGSFGVHLSHDRYFTEELDANLAQLPLELTMRRASGLSLQFLDQDGNPVRHKPVRLIRRDGDDDTTPLSAEGREWLALQPVPIKELNTNGNGQVHFGHLYPGKYDVEISLKTDTGEFGVWGEHLSAPKVWGRWSVEASDTTTQLTVDLTEHHLTRGRGYLAFFGHVRSKDGKKPIAGAEIRVTCGELSTSTFTSEAGKFSINALPGTVKYEISAPGHELLEGSFRSDFGGRKSLRFDLDPIE